MRHKAITVTGYVLIGLIVLGLAMEIILAAKKGHAFYGKNVYGLDLGTYSTMAVLVVVALVGVCVVFRRMRYALRRKRTST